MKDYVNSAALQEYTTKLVAKLKTLFPGTPTAAATVADMTDHSKTYVYVGSETGYTAGDWYYWDGTAWTSGGPFQATSIITDTTLAVAGEAADAKATGDAIAAAKTAVLNAMAPAYSTSATYAVGDYVNYNGSIYRCTTAITTAESWTSGHWTAVVLGADLAAQVSDLKTQLDEIVTIETLEFFSSASLFVVNGNLTVSIDGNGFTSVSSGSNGLIRLTLPTLEAGSTYKLHFTIEAGPVYAVRIRDFTASVTYAEITDADTGTYDLTFTAPNEAVYVFISQRYNVGTITLSDFIILAGIRYNNLDDTLTSEYRPAQGKAVGDRLNLLPSETWLGYGNQFRITSSDIVTNIGNVVAVITGNSISLSHSSSANAGISFALKGLSFGNDYIIEFDSETDFSVSNQTVRLAVGGTASVLGDTYAEFTKTGNHYVCEFRAIDYTVALQIPLKAATHTASLDSIMIRQAHLIEPQNVYCNYDGKAITTFNRCLCIGDSLTYGGFNADNVDPDVGVEALAQKYSYPTYLEKITGITVDKIATGGITSVRWWELYQNEDTSGHDMAIIQLGVNDAIKLNGWTEASITAFTNIINKLKTENTGIKIFIATTVPSPYFRGSKIDEVNAGIRTLVQSLYDPDVILADIHTYAHTADSIGYDAGHLTAYGYNRLAQDYVSLISYMMDMDMENYRFIQFIGTNYTYTDPT